MCDKTLGWMVSTIFGVGGLVLIFVPWLAPEVISPSIITFCGGIFGLIMAILSAMYYIYRGRCRRSA